MPVLSLRRCNRPRFGQEWLLLNLALKCELKNTAARHAISTSPVIALR